MHLRSVIVIVYLCVVHANCQFFDIKNLKNYAKIFNFGGLSLNQTENELWKGLIRDCDRSVTFSCIQKNAYTYLDNVFVERDNITVFEGLTMTKNNLDYGTCRRKSDEDDSMDENLVEKSSKDNCDEDESEEEKGEERGRQFGEEQSPLEEVTNALRKRAMKFLATRDYQIQLPDFFFERATIRISPREIDENGALVRVDFGQQGLESQGRIFKKISTMNNYLICDNTYQYLSSELNILKDLIDAFYFRKIYTEQADDKFVSPVAHHQANQIEVHVRDTVPIRRGHSEEALPEIVTFLYPSICARF